LFFKSGRDSSAFLWWAITVGAVWYGVVIVLQSSLAMPSEAWLIILIAILGALFIGERLPALGYVPRHSGGRARSSAPNGASVFRPPSFLTIPVV
jgi:hypothetical protein